jgi:hypothetical protein
MGLLKFLHGRSPAGYCGAIFPALIGGHLTLVWGGALVAQPERVRPSVDLLELEHVKYAQKVVGSKRSLPTPTLMNFDFDRKVYYLVLYPYMSTSHWISNSAASCCN